MLNNEDKKLIDLYVYRKTGPDLTFLLLKRSEKKKYAGQWRMIGGKVVEDETRWQAALRELNEETGLQPVLFWSVPTINHFYEAKNDSVHLIPAFAAEVDKDASVVLDEEHTGYRWVTIKQIDQFVLWPEQLRIIKSVNRIVTSDQILGDWIIRNDHT